MSARRLSIALLLVLCGACFIVPANVLGENPWDEADRPANGRSSDTIIVEDTAIIDTSGTDDQSLSSSPIPSNDSPDMLSSWFYDMVLYFGGFFRL